MAVLISWMGFIFSVLFFPNSFSNFFLVVVCFVLVVVSHLVLGLEKEKKKRERDKFNFKQEKQSVINSAKEDFIRNISLLLVNLYRNEEVVMKMDVKSILFSQTPGIYFFKIKDRPVAGEVEKIITSFNSETVERITQVIMECGELVNVMKSSSFSPVDIDCLIRQKTQLMAKFGDFVEETRNVK